MKRVVLKAAVVLMITQTLGCSAKPAPPAPTASAEPVVTAAPSATTTASSPAPARTHAPGTVPPPPTAKPAAATPDDASATTLTKLAAAKSRKAPAGSISVGSGSRGALVAITSDAGLALVDATSGAGNVIPQKSPDRFVMSADGSQIAVSAGGRIKLWDTAKGTLLQTFPITSNVMLFSADGKQLAAGSQEGVVLFDTASGKEITRAATLGAVFDLAFGAGGKEIVAMLNATQVVVISADTGKEVRGGGPADTGATFGIALSPDGRFAAAGAPSGHGMQVFDVHAWGPRTLVVVPEGACQEHVNPAFSPDGKLVLAYGGQRWVKAFDVGSWKPRASYHAPPGRVIQAIAKDLAHAVVTAEDGTGLKLTVVETGADVPLERPFAKDASYAFTADGQHLAGTAEASGVRVWSAKTGKIEYEETP